MNSKRNIGIDLLRIVAMLYVVILHSFSHGGVLDNLSFGTGNYVAAWGLEIWCYCAVDVFAIIAGYVGFRDKYKPVIARYLQLWLEVVFYMLLAYLFIYAVSPTIVSDRSILRAFFPLISGEYWFFSAFTGVLLLSPLVNASVRELSSVICKRFLFFIVFCISTISIISDPFRLQKGYSFGWLLAMFSVGAMLKKTGALDKVKSRTLLAVLLVSYFITFVMHMLQGTEEGFTSYNISLTSYMSPTITIIAVCYVILFSRIQFRSRRLIKIIETLSAGAFAVYLLNDSKPIREYAISGRFAETASINPIAMVLIIVGTGIAFTITCLLIDIVRRKIFQLLRVESISRSVEEKITRNL